MSDCRFCCCTASLSWDKFTNQYCATNQGQFEADQVIHINHFHGILQPTFVFSSPCCMNESARQNVNVFGVEPWREVGVISWLPYNRLSSLCLKQSRSTQPLTLSRSFTAPHMAAVTAVWVCMWACVCVCVHTLCQLTRHAWWVSVFHLLGFSCRSVASHSWKQYQSFISQVFNTFFVQLCMLTADAVLSTGHIDVNHLGFFYCFFFFIPFTFFSSLSVCTASHFYCLSASSPLSPSFALFPSSKISPPPQHL